MILKFIDWLNSLTGLVKKANYKFECGYIWAGIICHLILLAIICLFLFLVGGTLFFVGGTLFLVGLSHLEYINSSLVDIILLIAGLEQENLIPWPLLLIFDCFVLFVVYFSFHDWFDKRLDALLTRFCKQIPTEPKE